jgi:hypothetical protein
MGFEDGTNSCSRIIRYHVLPILSFCRLGGDGGWTDSNLTGCIHLYYHKKVVEMGFQVKPMGLGVNVRVTTIVYNN